MVAIQRELRGRFFPRVEIRVEVRIAEAVDRLLRVTDHEQRRLSGVCVAVDRIEDRELERVGVLEFVDQRGWKALAKFRRKPRIALVVKRLVQVRQHVVEGDDPTFAFAARQVLGDLFDHRADES